MIPRLCRWHYQTPSPVLGYSIASTAGATAEDRECCLQAGMDGYLGKLVRVEQLRQVLGKYLL